MGSLKFLKTNIDREIYVYQLQILKDNYTYICRWKDSGLVIDPGDSSPILDMLLKEGIELKTVLITHHHLDHVAGNKKLKDLTMCSIMGPDDNRIPNLDIIVVDRESLKIGPFDIDVISTPGHTKPHFVYFFKKFNMLFCGDFIFSGGIGRLFEGTPREMYDSINKIISLPDDTKIYCGHEYCVRNLEFAYKVDPMNEDVLSFLRSSKKRSKDGKFMVPTTLLDEKKINPFLRVNCRSFKKSLNMLDKDPVEVLAYLRNLKDRF